METTGQGPARPPMRHVVKCHPEEFQALLDGVKCHETRVADRDYRAGDTLELREFWPYGYPAPFPSHGGRPGEVWAAREARGLDLEEVVAVIVKKQGGTYTERWLERLITYVTPGGTWGLPEGLCVLSVQPIDIGEQLGLEAAARTAVNALGLREGVVPSLVQLRELLREQLRRVELARWRKARGIGQGEQPLDPAHLGRAP